MVQTKYIRNLQELEWNKEYWLYIITQGPVANNTRGFKVIPVVFKSPIYSNNGTNYRFRLANDNRQTYMVMNGPLHEMMNEVGGWKVLKYNRSDRSGGRKKRRKSGRKKTRRKRGKGPAFSRYYTQYKNRNEAKEEARKNFLEKYDKYMKEKGDKTGIQPSVEQMNEWVKESRKNVFHPNADYYTEKKYKGMRYTAQKGGKRRRKRKSKKKEKKINNF